MDGTATGGSDLDWPLSGNWLMAWAPPGNSLALAAVPVTADDVKDGLTVARYRARLSSRLRWLVGREADPLEAVNDLASDFEARDLWPGVKFVAESPEGRLDELLGQNPLWPDYLNLQIEFPDDDPMPVQPIPAAVRAVQETTLSEWMNLVLAG